MGEIGETAMMIPVQTGAKQAPALPTVVIVGAGFGGLAAARALKHIPVRVVLIDRHNYHVFQPLLYQVATAGLEPSSIARPVRTILRGQPRFEFRMTELTGLDAPGRRVHTTSGDIPFDFCILAVGGETNFFGLSHVERYGLGLKDPDEAVLIRNHVLRAFEQAVLEPDAERRRALLTFVIVGGGPTGVEMAGALSELSRLVLAKDYPRVHVEEVSIVLIEAADHLLGMMPPRLQAAALATLERKQVDVRLSTIVDDYEPGTVRLRGGQVISAHTLIWAAGVRAAVVATKLGLPTGRQQRIAVEPTLQVEGHPGVYVIGDAAYLEVDGQPLPMLAPVAIQMARAAALNIARQLRGRPPEPFRYRDPGTLATIGRNAAVAYIHGIAFKGFVAWLVWLFVHIIQLIGFRNKLVVLLDWAWDYFLYERAVRLISAE